MEVQCTRSCCCCSWWWGSLDRFCEQEVRVVKSARHVSSNSRLCSFLCAAVTKFVRERSQFLVGFAHARNARLTRHIEHAQHEQKSDHKINRTPHRSQYNATNREIIMLSKWFGKPRSQTKDNTKVECPQLSLRPSKEGNKVAILASGWFWVRAHCFGRVIIGIWNDSPSFLPGTATQVWENNRSCAVYCGILGR